MRVRFFGKDFVCTIGLFAVMLVAFLVSPCGAQTCTFTTSPAAIEAGHAGGTYTVNFTASGSACNWTVSSADDWITVTSAARGTGSGTFTVTVKPKTATAARQGRIDFRRQYVWVNQPPAPACTYTLTPTSRSHGPGNGQSVVTVAASDKSCTWNVGEMPSWLHTAHETKTGSGTVRYSYDVNQTTSARTGTIKVAGQTFTVTQEPCTFTVSPAPLEFTASDNTRSLHITTNNQDCRWSVESAAGWLFIQTAKRSGTGNGIVPVRAHANNTGKARSAQIKIKDKIVEATQQSLSCTYTLNPTSRSLTPGSGQTSVYVTASDPKCTWTVDEMAPWLNLTQQGQQGKQRTGSGSVHFGFFTNPSSSARTGTVKVAGQIFTVTQEPCTYTVNPSSINHSASHGGAGFTIKTNDRDCRWTVESTAGWIMIGSSEKSGKGDGHVSLHFTDNKTSSARSTQIKVKDKIVNVTQQGQAATQTTQPSAKTDPTSAQASVESPAISSTSAKKASSGGTAGCSFALSKTSQNIGAKDGKGSFSVKTDSGCEWRAVSNAVWISIASGSSGKGKGMVKFTVQENRESAARTGQIVIAGQTFSVNQKGHKASGKERKH